MWNYDRLLQITVNKIVLLSHLVFRAIRAARSVNSQGAPQPFHGLRCALSPAHV